MSTTAMGAGAISFSRESAITTPPDTEMTTMANVTMTMRSKLGFLLLVDISTPEENKCDAPLRRISI